MDNPELKLINEIKSAAEPSSFLGWNICIKVNQDKFHIFIFDRNIYSWIFAMVSSQVQAVKMFAE